MAIEGDTGMGATAAFTTLSGFAPAITEIELPPLFELEDINSTHLGSTDYEETQPGDISEAGEIKMTCILDTLDTMPTIGALDTIAVVFPLRTGEATAANYGGTGYFKKVGLPKLAKNELQTFEVVFKLNGATGPTYTKSVAA